MTFKCSRFNVEQVFLFCFVIFSFCFVFVSLCLGYKVSRVRGPLAHVFYEPCPARDDERAHEGGHAWRDGRPRAVVRHLVGQLHHRELRRGGELAAPGIVAQQHLHQRHGVRVHVHLGVVGLVREDLGRCPVRRAHLRA